MTAERRHILLLAGTPEARHLAERLTATFPSLRLTASFAGAVRDLEDPGVPMRVGGFGGAAGLKDWLREHAVSLVVDATHPFAAQMSRNAAEGCGQADVPLIRFERPAWTADERDRWQLVKTPADAAAALPSGARAFLAVGRKEIERFHTRHSEIQALVRMIEPPDTPLPDGWELLLARPGRTWQAEQHLLEAHAITHVVTKNSGGSGAFAKIEAARRMRLPVIMIERPVLPEVRTFCEPARVIDTVAALLRMKPD